MRKPWLALALFAPLSLAGCANILGIEDTQLDPLPAELSCVGKVPTPVGDGSTVDIVAFVVNIQSGMPIQDVRVRRCLSRLDLTCDNAQVFRTDANGMVTVPVTSGFNGYLRVEDPDMGVPEGDPARLVTYFWYFSQPIVASRPAANPFPIFAMTRHYRELALYDDVTGDTTTRGELAINATDCSDQNVAGIRFEITTPASEDAMTVPFYFANQLISINPPLESQVTDEMNAIGGFRSVIPGTVQIRSVHAASGTVVAVDSVRVQADVLTTVRLLPQ